MVNKLYEIVESVPKSDMTHVRLNLVDSDIKEVIENNIKLKIATSLEDEAGNIFRVNGYFGNYIILRPTKAKQHPIGKYLTWKMT